MRTKPSIEPELTDDQPTRVEAFDRSFDDGETTTFDESPWVHERFGDPTLEIIEPRATALVRRLPSVEIELGELGAPKTPAARRPVTLSCELEAPLFDGEAAERRVRRGRGGLTGAIAIAVVLLAGAVGYCRCNLHERAPIAVAAAPVAATPTTTAPPAAKVGAVRPTLPAKRHHAKAPPRPHGAPHLPTPLPTSDDAP
jgi:hypothetical protein